MFKCFKTSLAILTILVNMSTTTSVLAAVPENEIATQLANSGGGAIFPIGELNSANAAYFTGTSYVAWLSDKVHMGNVTFVDGAHTHWHIHHKSCQILIAESGRGYYQIWGEEPHELLPGMTVTIPEGVKHWHGAAPNSSFQHIAVMEDVPGISNEWLEEVNHDAFALLK